MSVVHVIVDRRPRRWVRALLLALDRHGVEVRLAFATVDAPYVLDARSSPASPAGWRLVVGTERGGIPAFEEGVTGAECVDAALACYRNGEARTVRSGRFPYAHRHDHMMALVLDRCAQWLRDEMAAPTPFERGMPFERPPRRSITPLAALRFAAAELVRTLRHALRYAFEEVRWDVAVTSTPVERFVEDPRAAWLHWIARDEREFLADPFITRTHAGNPWLLCETLDRRTPCIVGIDLNDRFGHRTPLIGGGTAASYPYVLEVDGERWLVPEQARRNAVHAYRLNGKVEELRAPLLDGVAALDPTIVHHDGRWWLFCTDRADAPNYALRIYWADHPAGPWHAHARNPAKVDISGARPAGNFFVRDGVLHRPAQDCRGRYGRALVIQRIDALTPEEFRETPVARIDVSVLRRKGAVGMHTLSYGEGWVALDAQFARWSLKKPFRVLRGDFA